MKPIIFSMLLVSVSLQSIHANSSDSDNSIDDNGKGSEKSSFDLGRYLQMSCPKRLKIDRKVVRAAERCLQQELNDEVISSLFILITSKHFQKFSSEICRLWPGVRGCLDGVIDYLENCHDKSYLGQVTDEIARYACLTAEGAEPGTTHLGDYFDAGGLFCPNYFGFFKCYRFALDKTLKFCTMMEKIRECAKPSFRGCSSSKPWSIVSGLFDEVEQRMNCGPHDAPIEDVYTMPIALN